MMAEQEAAKYARQRRPNGIAPIDLEDAEGGVPGSLARPAYQLLTAGALEPLPKSRSQDSCKAQRQAQQ